jgi:hypothetical protein
LEESALEGKTHLLTAAAAFSVINLIAGTSGVSNITNIFKTPDIALISLGAIITGSIVPDLDQPGSTAGSKITLVNMKMVKLFVNLFLLIFGVLIVVYSGNKYTLYWGGAILVFLLLTYRALTNKILHMLRRVIQIALIAALVFTYAMKREYLFLFLAIILLCYFFSKHRGLSHTLVLSIVASIFIYTAFMYYGYAMYGYYAAAYFFVGCFLHIFICDYLTDKGVPNPLYPVINILMLPVNLVRFGFTKKAFKESFKITKVRFFFTFNTGSAAEVAFSMGCAALTIFSFVMGLKNFI